MYTKTGECLRSGALARLLIYGFLVFPRLKNIAATSGHQLEFRALSLAVLAVVIHYGFKFMDSKHYSKEIVMDPLPLPGEQETFSLDNPEVTTSFRDKLSEAQRQEIVRGRGV